jgi:hypothetical protein
MSWIWRQNGLIWPEKEGRMGWLPIQALCRRQILTILTAEGSGDFFRSLRRKDLKMQHIVCILTPCDRKNLPLPNAPHL